MAIYKSKYTGKQVDSILDNVENKQNILTPGRGIDIQNDVISLSDDTEYSTLDDRITDVENAISNIGGVNYNSYYPKEIEEHTINSNSDFGDYVDVCYCPIYPLNSRPSGDSGYDFLIKEDTNYITLSTYIKSERNLDPYIQIYTDDGEVIYIRQKELKASNNYSRYYTTIDITDYPNINEIYLEFTPFPEDYGNDIIVSYYGGQIEKGKVLTDYSYPMYAILNDVGECGNRLNNIENKLNFIGTSNLLTKDERIDIPVLQSNQETLLKRFTPNDFTYRRVPNNYILSFKLGIGYKNPNCVFYFRTGGSNPNRMYSTYNDRLNRYIIKLNISTITELSGYLYVKNRLSTPSDPDYIEDLQIEIGEIPSDYHKVINSEQVIKISWSNLKSKRDNGELIPGMQYRITDYVTTTIQADTQSAGHPFDVIVTALDTNKLSEIASAIQSTRDTDGYFSNSNLVAWQLWYCLDNDTNRFSWADSTNGKGVIYQMIDEFNNDCPYDFKNIQFKRYKVTGYTGSGGGDVGTSLVYDIENNPKYYGCLNMHNNKIPSNFTLDTSSFIWYYTFSGLDSNKNIYDMSSHPFKLSQSTITSIIGDDSGTDIMDRCNDNIISPLMQEYFIDDIYFKGRQTLNNIVFIGNVSYDDGPYNGNSISSIYENKFGVDCRDNTFGNSHTNAFGNYCNSNTFGNFCIYNIFGNYFYNNTFGDDCRYNIFGNYLMFNIFGDQCDNNIFENNCRNNIFGNNFTNNTFGNNSNTNTFGNYCNSNTVENDCGGNTFGNYCKYNTFGNYCKNIKFASDSSASAKYDYYQHNHFGDGCKYIVFTGAETASNSQQVQNYNFAQGLQGASNAYLTIDGVRNLSYETKVAKNSNGEIKIYCEADLIL